eukprot:COSAG02_NODE_231_length_27944_cov_5.843347_5_plen_406_part_00
MSNLPTAYSPLQQHERRASGGALSDDGAAADDQPLVPTATAIAAGRPYTGCRLWFQMDSMDSCKYSGRLLLAFHFTEQGTVATEAAAAAAAAAAATDGRRGSTNDEWEYVATYKGATPDVAVSCSTSSEVYERDVFVKRSTGEVYVWLGLRIVVACGQNIARFPFDRQTVRIGVTSRNFRLQAWSLSNPPIAGELCTADATACRVDSEAREWRLVDVKDVQYFNDMQHSSYFRFIFRVERLSGYYVTNFGVPTFLLGLIPLAVLSLDPVDDVGDRLAICLTVLLTLMAQKLVVAQAVPICSYNTQLDNYVVFSMFWVIGYIAQVAFMAHACSTCSGDGSISWCVGGGKWCSHVDQLFHGSATVAWILLHGIALLDAPGLLRLRETWQEVDKRMESMSFRQTLKSE